jgi:hypothetical protein
VALLLSSTIARWSCVRWPSFCYAFHFDQRLLFLCFFLSLSFPLLSLPSHISQNILNVISHLSFSLLRELCLLRARATLLFVVHLHFLLLMLFSAATAIAGNSGWHVGCGGRGGIKEMKKSGTLAPACCCCLAAEKGEGEGGWLPVAIAVRFYVLRPRW